MAHKAIAVDDAKLADLHSAVPHLQPRDREFAIDLIHAEKRYGGLTEKQLPWVDKLIERANAPKVEAPTIEVGDFAGVIALFNKAKGKLKFPKIGLMVGDVQVFFSLAGSGSKAPGYVNVMGEGQYPNRPWFGRISPAGQWQPGKGITPEFQAALLQLLTKFAQKPARVAKEYGKMTGNCCFCMAGLSNDKSIAAGFGPKCAENYGLVEEWKTAVKKAETPLLDIEPEVVQAPASTLKAMIDEVVQAVQEEDAQVDGPCFLCETNPAEMVKNGYRICSSCANELEM